MAERQLIQLGLLAANEPGSIAIGPFGSRMKAELYVATGVPIIRGTNISSGSSWKGDWVYVPEAFAAEMPNCLTRPGDLVFPHRGSIGEVALIPDDGITYMISTSLMKFRPDTRRVSPEFLLHFFRSSKGRAEILRFASQVGTPGIGQPLTSLRQFQVDLPPLPIQRAIAATLGSLNDKIELNRRMNETLEAMARAIFQDWFVTFGPTRAKMEGRPPYLAPDLWSLFPDRLDAEGKPEGWAISTVGQEFRLTMGQSPPGETYNASGNGLPFFQGRTDFGFRYPKHRIFCTAPTRRAEADDTLISVRAPVGDLNLARATCCIGRGVAAARHRLGSRSYTYYALWAIQPDLTAFEHTGTVFGAINKAQFELLKVIAPDDRLLAAFETIATPMDDRIQHNEEQISSLIATRDLLLPRLMSGELRVRDFQDNLQRAE
jgi:type I restriction enzyme S subunit